MIYTRRGLWHGQTKLWENGEVKTGKRFTLTGPLSPLIPAEYFCLNQFSKIYLHLNSLNMLIVRVDTGECSC